MISKLNKEMMKINIIIVCIALVMAVLGGIIYFMYPTNASLAFFVVEVFCLGLDIGVVVGRWRKHGKKQN